MRSLSMFTLGAAALVLTAGCKKNDEQPPQTGYQQPPPGYQQPPPGYQQPPPGYQQPPPGYQQPPPGQNAPPPNTPTTPPPPRGGGQATPVDANMAAAAMAIIGPLAQSQAPGAKAVGSPLAGNFQQGQTLEAAVQLSPGKCYTVVAAGAPGVSEVNVQLVATTPLPGLAPVLAQDADTGAQAVLGKAPDCYKWAFMFSAPAKVVLTVAGGAGLAAAQVYEK